MYISRIGFFKVLNLMEEPITKATDESMERIYQFGSESDSNSESKGKK